MLKRTALYETHQSLGARLVEFGGWEMPVQYSSIIDEHLAVRSSSGIFDISHMGEIFVSGGEALRFVNLVLTNDASQLSPGEGQYTLMCNDSGGVVDDLYLFRVGEEEFLWVVNASRIDAVAEWLDSLLTRFSFDDLTVENRSDAFSAVAIQGPRVTEFIEICLPGASVERTCVERVGQLAKNEIAKFEFHGATGWVSRTGYTGEDGFEVIVENHLVSELWKSLMDEGHKGCLQPIGLGARDTLRTEMGYPLYGHELGDLISPLEAGLGYFVKLGKEDFVGKQALLAQKSAGLARRSVAFKMIGKTPPPRPDYSILVGSETVGITTSGSVSPCLKTGIGMALIDVNYAKPGNDLSVEIRGRPFPAVTVKKPIYSKKSS